MAKKKNTTPIDDMKEAQKAAQEWQPRTMRGAEELAELMMTTKVRTLVDINLRKEFQKEHNLLDLELVAMMASSAAYIPNMASITIKKDCDITFKELHDAMEKVQVNFIIIRRVNYILHQAMITVYDYLEKYNKLRFTTKKHYLNAESEWTKYEEARRKVIEKTAWYTLQDHLRITNDFLQPRIEALYSAVRDHMIRLGWRDVELKGRIEVVFMMFKMARSSFLAYFKDFYNETGVDFTKLYFGDSMDGMAKHFVLMVNVLGIKTFKNEHGYYDILGYEGKNNQRVEWAWNDFIKDVRDDDLMDEAAKKAIELNPKARDEYHQILEDSEKEQMDKEVDKLSDKFKVTKSK